MSFISEFKKFALRGNVVDLAVGVVIGTAFGKIVSSLVADVIMPPVGVLLGGVDFVDLKLQIKAATVADPAVTINYGQFINTMIDFLIVALAIFTAIRIFNRLTGINVMGEKEPTKGESLLTEIRDILKERK